MSKQLAISSSFCTFALAAMALFASPVQSGLHGGDPILNMQAESPAPGLIVPSLLRD